jgi:hypothetical protein
MIKLHDSAEDFLMDSEPCRLGFGFALAEYLSPSESAASTPVNVFAYQGK